MVKNKIIFGLIVTAFLISGCESINTPEAGPISKLEGKWSCNYEISPFLIFFPTPEPDTLVSLIEFKGDSFFVIIDKPENIFPEIKNNSRMRDYSGRYETEKDTLRFYVPGDEPFMEDFIFSTRGDKMQLSTAPKAGPNGFLIVRMGSFLWRDAFGKMSGTFERVKERRR